MVRVHGNHWALMAVLVVVAVLAGSLLVGIQTSQAKRWIFDEGFQVEALAVSETGDYFVTASRSPAQSASVLHFFRAEQVDWNATADAPVTALGIASSGALVAAGHDTGGLRLYTGRGDALGILPTQAPVRDVAVSADGGLIAAATGNDHRATDRGGLLLYRLGNPAPLLHVPKADVQAVRISADGEVLVAALGGGATTGVLLYDRAVSPDRPYLIDTYPGALRSLQLASDGRHALVITENAAFLLARGHERPVGIVPTLLGPEPHHAGGALAPDGQSYLLVDHDHSQVRLHKWGEASPRWTHSSDIPYVSWALDADGDRATVIDASGHITVLSVTTGRAIKELALLGDPGTMVPSADGAYVFASDDEGRLYRARSGYAGLLGVLPDAIVSTLFAQPTALLWFGVIVAFGGVSYPFAQPLIARYIGRKETEEPDLDLDAIGRVPIPDRAGRDLDGPVTTRGLFVTRDETPILKGVDLDAPPGTVTAIVGGSGEGKSTLLAALLGHGITRGTVRLGTIDPTTAPQEVRKLVGFVPQDLQLYTSLTPHENLVAFGGQYGLPRETLARHAARYLSLVGLDPQNDRPVSRLSGGERRRVSIAATLLNDPAVLILDEPTTGLDPLTRRQLWRLLGTLRARLGVTVLVTTHYLEEAQAADNVLLLEDGQVLARGAPEAITESAPGGPLLWRIRLPDGPRDTLLAEAVREAAEHADVPEILRDITTDGDTATIRLTTPPGDAAVLLRALRQAGHEPQGAEWVPMRFEDAFIAHIAEARAERRRDAGMHEPHEAPDPTPAAEKTPTTTL